jgi:DNA-binding response OmpR family regulator
MESLFMEPQPTVLYIGRLTSKDVKQSVEALAKRFDLLTAGSAKAGLNAASTRQPQLVIWDAASLRTHGDRALKTIRSTLPTVKLIRILGAGERASNGLCDVTLHGPITVRRLCAQIEKLLKQPGDETLTAGPFAIQLQRRVLTVSGHDVQLNPKLAALFEVFMRNANQTVNRATLMSVVWQTDYVGDTRTLDVHISKVRDILKAVGANDRLRTVRGIGYRLDVTI